MKSDVKSLGFPHVCVVQHVMWITQGHLQKLHPIHLAAAWSCVFLQYARPSCSLMNWTYVLEVSFKISYCRSVLDYALIVGFAKCETNLVDNVDDNYWM